MFSRTRIIYSKGKPKKKIGEIRYSQDIIDCKCIAYYFRIIGQKVTRITKSCKVNNLAIRTFNGINFDFVAI